MKKGVLIFIKLVSNGQRIIMIYLVEGNRPLKISEVEISAFDSTNPREYCETWRFVA